MRLSELPRVVTTAMLLTCAIPPAVAGQHAAPRPRGPLASFASQHIIVLPVQYLRQDDRLGWGAAIPSDRRYLATVDAEIRYALVQRGLGKLWTFPNQLEREVKRNPTYAPDPYDLAAGWLRYPLKKAPDQLPDPLASQIRSLIAFEDGARYLLFPVEVRFAAADSGRQYASLRVVVLDARMSTIVWMGDVGGDPDTKFSPALAVTVAEHLADLIAAP